MSRIQLFDRFVFDAASHPRLTSDGYLVAMPRVARTGIQLYAGREVGRPDMKVVRVYRPPETVFDKESMASFAYKPVTDDHPSVPVTADNWKDLSVGTMGGEMARDGEFLRVPMVIMDKSTIRKVRGGKVELSAGYMADLKWESGLTPDTKEEYDAVQLSVKDNHVAIVKAARGGEKLRIGDDTEPDALDETSDSADTHQKDEANMTDKALQKMMVDGIQVEMTDTAVAIVDRHLKSLGTQLADAVAKTKEKEEELAKLKKEKETSDAAAATTLATKDAEIATLKKKVEDSVLTPAALDTMVKDRAEVIGKAKIVIGDKLVVDGKTIADIKKQVVGAKMGDAAKDWSEDAINASFQVLTNNVASSAVADTAAAFSGGGQRPGFAAQVVSNDQRQKLYSDADKKLEERWKGPKTA